MNMARVNVLFVSVAMSCLLACAKSQESNEMLVNGVTYKDATSILVFNLNKQKMQDTLNVENGTFVYTAPLAEKDVFLAFVDPKTEQQVDVVTDGNNINVDMLKGVATGTPLNDKLAAMKEQIDAKTEFYAGLKKKYDVEKDEAVKRTIKKQFSNYSKDIYEILSKTVEDNQDNCLPAYLLLKMLGFQEFDFEKLQVYNNSKAVYIVHPLFNMVNLYAEEMRPSTSFVGKNFIDVEAKDFNGKTHKLSEYVGKGNYVLVDFWASWCGPCMREMPIVKSCWEKYKDKGFTVVGISLDHDMNNWKSAVKAGGYDWVHISDLGGWKSKPASVYGVQSIPWNFLCDGDGKIVAVSLRGQDLEERLDLLYE